MIPEHSPWQKRQTRSVSPLEHSPLSKIVKNYLLSCRVEGKAPGTIESYGRILKQFQALAVDGEPTPTDVRFYLLSLHESGNKASTIHKHFRALRTFFNWTVNENLMIESPMRNIHPPKLPTVVFMPYSAPDIDNMMTLTSAQTFLEVRNRAMILVFLDTGIRLEEMATVQLEDLSIESETIKINGKGNKERLVRIGRTTQKALLRYLVMRGEKPGGLWLTEEYHAMHRRGISIMICRICKVAVTSGARPSPHTFRHTAAINYLRNGGDLFTLQIMLGHSSLEMTRRYVSSLGAADMFRIHKIASPVDKLNLK